MQQLGGATSEVKIRKLRYFWRSFRLQVATDLTEEGKIGQFRRIWGPLQYTKFDPDRSRGLVQGGKRISLLAV